MIDTTQLDKSAQAEAIELRDALVSYKRRSGRMFPTCSEVLEVIRDLGYERFSLDVEQLAESENSAIEMETVA